MACILWCTICINHKKAYSRNADPEINAWIKENAKLDY